MRCHRLYEKGHQDRQPTKPWPGNSQNLTRLRVKQDGPQRMLRRRLSVLHIGHDLHILRVERAEDPAADGLSRAVQERYVV